MEGGEKMQRLRITIDFNKNREDDLKLYETLLKYSSPGAHIKDVLKGLSPLPNMTNDTSKE
ncbi:hypothetical protein SDC9_99198 [bioreactor metagenome]|jgi:hypothetical protein|uniref:Uncharacterized protein n=2 Tax=root TaxID=1 RepID=A0A645AGY0_9ZZZZ